MNQALTYPDVPKLYCQEELNDFFRNLGFSKEHAKFLGSSLQKKHLLYAGVTYSWYRRRQNEFTTFYYEEKNVVYCKNIHVLMSQLTLQYEPFKWRLFIDSLKSDLKAILLHNGNIFPSIHVQHSINLKENYKDLAVILQKLRYEDHG